MHATSFTEDELIVDNFAGGGGASLGIEMALGRTVDIAVNHDREAVAIHLANHPKTKHYCCVNCALATMVRRPFANVCSLSRAATANRSPGRNRRMGRGLSRTVPPPSASTGRCRAHRFSVASVRWPRPRSNESRVASNDSCWRQRNRSLSLAIMAATNSMARV